MTEIDTDTNEATAEATERPERLDLTVKIESPTACERHVTVTVSEKDIQRYRAKVFNEIGAKAVVPGFRPGRAPHKLVQSRFREEVDEQVKSTLLMDSLTQVNEDHALTSISEPNLDVGAVNLPADGPMTFEFNLEVRPEFELPEWRGLKLERPVREYSEDEVTRYTHKLLAKYGQREPTSDPIAEGDYVAFNVTVRHEGTVISRLFDREIQVKTDLSFADAKIVGFAATVVGASVGETRNCKTKLGYNPAKPDLQGQELDVDFEVLDVQRLVQPKLDRAFLEEIGGFQDENDLRSAVADELNRQLKYHQQQRLRQQITGLLTATANWELPQALLRRQARREVERSMMELQASGFSENMIRAHINELRQNTMASTARALKEHFILEKIAEDQKIEALPKDYDKEIELIAEQQDESPRRARARLEKKGQMDSLRNQIIERKVIEMIEAAAEFKEVLFEPRVDNVTAIDVSLCGEESSEIPEAKHGDGPEPLPHQPEHH
ncbi:MAG: trigger factor [Planctomycetes bacterium]|nr:trigger factor [Planctomycetota bacterium]